MQDQVAIDLSESATAFLRVVWPNIKEVCGGGELIPVESVTATGFARTIDMLAGIDAWQVARDNRGMRGIASRVQWDKAWDTFTIRHSRDSGARTEYEKRTWVLDHPGEGWLYPAITVQAYVERGENGKLLSAAVTRTGDIFEFIKNEPEVSRREANNGNGWYYERTNNATFIVVRWNNMQNAGRRIHIVRPSILAGCK